MLYSLIDVPSLKLKEILLSNHLMIGPITCVGEGQTVTLSVDLDINHKGFFLMEVIWESCPGVDKGTRTWS